MLRVIALLSFLPMPLQAQESAPPLLLIVQERLRAGQAEAYGDNESQIARVCARFKCPHPYLALESVETPKEVWWLTMFASEADKDRVEREFARNEPLMAELRPLSSRKPMFTHTPMSLLTRHRPELGTRTSFNVIGARFFVITTSDKRSKAGGAVFESPDGRHIAFAPAASRGDADQIAAREGAGTAIFAVQPRWSFPADAWITADPEFWKFSPATQARQSTTRYAISKDGTRMAYDVRGAGPAVMLLHGGGQTRRVWHDAGYVAQLAQEFTVVTVDLRGHGESDKPSQVAAYQIGRLTDDLLAVADSAGLSQFSVWGYSYGANIGRYLAVRSDRVRSMVYIGISFGAAADGTFAQMIRELRAKWTPVIDAHRAGRLDIDSLAESDRTIWLHGTVLGTVPVSIAWLSAMLDYPPVEPADMRCPTLWVVGTANAGAVESLEAHPGKLSGTRVSIELFEGLTHAQEFESIDQVFAKEVAFARMHR
jgi:pimeloyl-ACP methyl ester carboxylesterase